MIFIKCIIFQVNLIYLWLNRGKKNILGIVKNRIFTILAKLLIQKARKQEQLFYQEFWLLKKLLKENKFNLGGKFSITTGDYIISNAVRDSKCRHCATFRRSLTTFG